MPIVILCVCGKRFGITHDVAGRRGACPICKATFVAPEMIPVESPPGVVCPNCHAVQIAFPPNGFRLCWKCEGRLEIVDGQVTHSKSSKGVFNEEVQAEWLKIRNLKKTQKALEALQKENLQAWMEAMDENKRERYSPFIQLYPIRDALSCDHCKSLPEPCIVPAAKFPPDKLPPFDFCTVAEGCQTFVRSVTRSDAIRFGLMEDKPDTSQPQSGIQKAIDRMFDKHFPSLGKFT